MLGGFLLLPHEVTQEQGTGARSRNFVAAVNSLFRVSSTQKVKVALFTVAVPLCHRFSMG